MTVLNLERWWTEEREREKERERERARERVLRSRVL